MVDARDALRQQLLIVAEEELERALLAQSGPSMMTYMHSSSAERAALQRAIQAICREAHRLDLRAEELIVGIKRAWSHLSHVRARHLGDRDGDVLRDVVSSSIKLFFEAGHTGAPAPRLT